MGFVYFISEPQFERVKIGWSRTPEVRLGQLQTGTPYELKLMGCVEGSLAHENHLHKYLAAHRVQGEWFEFSDEVKSTVNGLISGKIIVTELLVEGESFIGCRKDLLPDLVGDEDLPVFPPTIISTPADDFVDKIQEQYLWTIGNGDEWKRLLRQYIHLVNKTGLRPSDIRFDIDPTSPWVLPFANVKNKKYFLEFKAYLFDFTQAPEKFGRTYIAMKTLEAAQ